MSPDSETATVIRGVAARTAAPPPRPVSPAPFLHFAPGQPFGERYTIVEEVGTGGMGQVYKVLDRSLGRPVALKLIRPEAASHTANIERFRRELALAREVTHTNVCRVHDLGEQDGLNYLTMEFIEGQTLEDLIQSVGHLSPRQTVALGRQICAGLTAIHEKAIVHRDLKPGNVMVDRAGHARLMDFGMAYHHGQDRLTGAGGVMGTLAYLSPEQARGKDTDARSDIYAVGLILYEMLTGRRAPGDGGQLPLALRDAGERCPPPSQLSPEVPPTLDAVVMRCVERDPDRRFASVVDLEQALARIADSLTLISSTTPIRTTPLPSRRWLLLLGAAALVLPLALPAVRERLLGWLRGGPPSGSSSAAEPVLAVMPLSSAGDGAGDNDLAVGVTEMLINALGTAPTLTVVSRAEMRAYGSSPPPLEKIVRNHGLTHVVTGSVQRQGDRLRGTVNLLRGDGTIVSALDYEDRDAFTLVGRLAEGLRASLRLTATNTQSAPHSPTTDLAAFLDYSRGLALLDRRDVKGNGEAAVGHFESAVRRDPRFTLAHAALGEAYLAQHRESGDAVFATKAVSAILVASNQDSGQPRVRVALAMAYRRLGQPDEAMEELGKAIELQSRNDEAHRLMGDILADGARWQEAEAEIRKAIAIRPLYWAHYASLGYLFYRAGRMKDAITAYEQATRLQPDNAEAHQMLGAAYQRDGDDAQALERYRKANSLLPNPKTYSNIGTIHYDRGQFELAAQAYEEAVKLQPNSAPTQRNLGDAYERLERREEARARWREAARLSGESLRVNAKDGATLATLAVCEAKLESHPEAAVHAAEALLLAPEANDVVYRVAVVHALSGRPQDAIDALQRALSLGYSAPWAQKDYDLRSLRQLPEYKRLFNRSR